MRITALVVVLGVVAGAAGPAAADEYARIAGRVTAEGSGDPVAGATVYVSGAHGTEQVVTTDDDGRYRALVKGSGSYAVVIVFDRERKSIVVEAALGKTTTVDGVIDTDHGEVIVLNDLRPPPVPAAMKQLRRAPPAYSDAAIEHDAWTTAWFLLDIDEHGRVVRLKFLKRPGYDLERTAVKEAFATRFDAARDGRGNRIRSRLIWPLEWQSYWWLIYRTGLTTSYVPSFGVPCKGSGPLALDSKHPVYRDCEPPDLSKMKSERWIESPDAELK